MGVRAGDCFRAEPCLTQDALRYDMGQALLRMKGRSRGGSTNPDW